MFKDARVKSVKHTDLVRFGHSADLFVALTNLSGDPDREKPCRASYGHVNIYSGSGHVIRAQVRTIQCEQTCDIIWRV